MANLEINRDSGRKPYIEVSRGINGGYVNEMRRPTQLMDKIALNRQATEGSRGRRGEVLADREVTKTTSLVSVWTPPGVCWGLAFDSSGGLYATVEGGDIYYRPYGGSFGALSQTARNWQEISVAPNGNVYCVDFGAGIYVRTGGTGDFTLLEAGAYVCVACSPNGSVYALKASQLYKWNGSAFASMGETSRGYAGLACAANNDLYSTVYGTGKIYIMAGGTGHFVELTQTILGCWNLAAGSDGDVYLSSYSIDWNVYKRPQGSGDFVAHQDMQAYISALAVSPTGYLHASTNLYSAYLISMVNTQTITQQPVNTIVQNKTTPKKHTDPKQKHLKPYENKSYTAMKQYAVPVKYTGKSREAEPEKRLPVLVGHIEEIGRFVRSGNPVVVNVPVTARDVISRVMVEGGGDGTATVAPNGRSVVYKPGLTSAALLVIITKSGQLCTATLMAK